MLFGNFGDHDDQRSTERSALFVRRSITSNANRRKVAAIASK